jgi:peptide/nickel transport system permease protein
MFKHGAIPSLMITLPAFLLGIFLAVSLSLFFVFVRDSLIDVWGIVLCVALMSVPAMVYVIFGQWLLANQLRYFPAFGFNREGFSTVRFLALPVSIMVFSGMGGSVRFYRTIFLEETRADYIRTALAKGSSHARVLFTHVLKNGLISLITVVVAALPSLILGSLIIESFFGIPGLGEMSKTAIATSDFTLIRADVYLGSLLYLLGLLLTDICYALVDPRIRLS